MLALSDEKDVAVDLGIRSTLSSGDSDTVLSISQAGILFSAFVSLLRNSLLPSTHLTGQLASLEIEIEDSKWRSVPMFPVISIEAGQLH